MNQEREGAASGVSPSFAEQHLNLEAPQPTINYAALSDYADKHRLHFNELCRVVRDACGVKVPHTPEAISQRQMYESPLPPAPSMVDSDSERAIEKWLKNAAGVIPSAEPSKENDRG